MATLHITNGDAVAGTLNELSDDPVLPWRDVLHDGPVPGNVDAAELQRVRARFLSDSGWTTFEVVLADIVGRDAQLAACGAGDTLVLWFEPDLYDQLQLVQILARLYIRPVAERPAITIIPADALLGTIPKSGLAKYIDQQRVVREADLEIAAQAWEAFTSSDNTFLVTFASSENALHAANSYAEDDAVVLPYLHGALRRLLQEYPDDRNGLSRTEQQTVDVLLQGARTVGDVYQQAHAPREEWTWLGDWSFAWYVERMMRAAVPLIAFVDGDAPVDLAEAARAQGAAFWKRKIRLTEAGELVARGDDSAIRLNGIDRWIGGVHLLQAPRS